MAAGRNRSLSLRRHRSDAGFTLVEVMAVVLVIGVLLAIAIPTLRGAQQRAQDAAARSSLAVASSAALQLSEAGENFSHATVDALADYEPTLDYVQAGVRSTGPAEVSVDSSMSDQWTGAARSESGNCYVARASRTGTAVTEVDPGSDRACSAREAGQSSPSFIPGASGGTGSYEGSVADGSTIRPDGERQSDDTIFVYDESRRVLANDLALGATVVPAGTAVCPYLLVYDPVERSSFDTTVEFPGPVLGVARTLSELRDTAEFANPDATYVYRPFEGSDRAAVMGSRIEIDIAAIPGNADMIRVFTAC